MALNWTLEVVLGFVSFIINVIILGIITGHIVQERHRHAPFMISNVFGLALWTISRSLGVLFLSTLFIWIGVYSILLTAISTFLLVDSLTRDTIDAKKLIVFFIVTTIFVIMSLDQSSLYFGEKANGEIGVIYREDFSVLVTVVASMIGGVFLYYMIVINHAAPKSLKQHTQLGLLTGLLQGVLVPLIVLAGLRDMYPGIAMLVISFGLFPWTIAAVRQPKVAYILPFRVMKLMVIDTLGGLPFFSHTWDEQSNLVDDSLFSGMLQGIGMILDESVKRGGIREISLENAIIIMRRSEHYPVACVLVANKSTQTLRHALESFAVAFFEKYAQYFDNVGEISKFADATELIKIHFAFVPEYN